MRTQALKKHLALIVLLGAVAALLLAACTTETPLETNGSQPMTDAGDQVVEVALSEAPNSQNEAASQNESGEDDNRSPDDVAGDPGQINICLDCHSDKEQLISTAAPEVEVVEESEGEG